MALDDGTASVADASREPGVTAQDEKVTYSNVHTEQTEQTEKTIRSDSSPAQSLDPGREARDEQNQDDEVQQLSTFRLTVVTVSLCLAVFLVALDNTIIATAIPRITDQFHSVDDVGWYASAYLLTTCAFQLFFGKLYTFYSVKWVFLVAIFVFEVGSLICGVAPNSVALIVGRAIAGLGCAGIFSGAILILSLSVPMRKRPVFLALIGSMYGVASVAGPLMGGAFTDSSTWRWCFYINLPIGGITMFFITFFYKAPPTLKTADTFLDRMKTLDLPGTAIFLPCVICLLLALQWGGTTYAWGSWRIIFLLVLFGVLAVVFCVIQWVQGDHATVPLRIIRQRTVLASSLFICAIAGSFFAFVYYIPIWLQAVRGVSAVRSGIDNLPMLLGTVFASLVAGAAVSAIGYWNPFCILSVVLMSIGAGLMTTWTPQSSTGMWVGYQLIYGLGVGSGLQQALIAVQAVLPAEDIATGTAVSIFVQTFGGAVFVSVTQNIFQNKLVTYLTVAAPAQNVGAIIAVGATSIRRFVPPEILDAVVQAYNDAITESFYVGTALACVGIVGAVSMEWKNVKGMRPGGGGH